MMGGGSQSQGVFGLPQSPFPSFGANSPNQSQARTGFQVPQISGPFQGGTQAPQGPQSWSPSGPFYGGTAAPFPANQAPNYGGMPGMAPQTMPGNPYAFNMQTPQNTQGLNQGQINSGVYTKPDGTISFSGGPAAPLSPMTAAFLGQGPAMTTNAHSIPGAPTPTYPGGQTQGFGPTPPAMQAAMQQFNPAPPTGGAQPFQLPGLASLGGSPSSFFKF